MFEHFDFNGLKAFLKACAPEFAGVILIQTLFAVRIYLEDSTSSDAYLSQCVQAVILYAFTIVAGKLLCLPRPIVILHVILFQAQLAIQSLCGEVSSEKIVVHQFVAICVGLMMAILASTTLVKYSSKMVSAMLAASLLIVMAITYFSGNRVNGSVLSISIGRISVNIIEPLKLLFAGLISCVLTSELSESLRYLLTVVLGAAAIACFTYLSEAGTLLLILSAIFVLCLISLPRKYTIFNIMILCCGSFAFVLFARFSVHAAQLLSKLMTRISAAIDPTADALGTGYQQLKAGECVLLGGLWGATYKIHLPLAQSDYIYSYITLKFGCFAAVLIVFSYFIIYLEFIKSLSAIETKSNIGFVGACGALTLLLVETLLPTAGNLGIIPMTGLPLPWLGSGGAALCSTEFCFWYISITVSRRSKPWLIQSLHVLGTSSTESNATHEPYNRKRRPQIHEME